MDLPFPSFENEKPSIAYPCTWQYKVIGHDQFRMQTAIGEILAELEYTLELSNTSRTGKYCSLLLTLVVASEEHRDAIFAAISGHRDVRVVL
jgi:putative lipoic acid-binding regulatory protein